MSDEEMKNNTSETKRDMRHTEINKTLIRKRLFVVVIIGITLLVISTLLIKTVYFSDLSQTQGRQSAELTQKRTAETEEGFEQTKTTDDEERRAEEYVGDYSSGDYWYSLYGDGKAMIFGFLEDAEELIVPEIIDGHPVKGLYADFLTTPPFVGDKSPRKISVPKSVTYISPVFFDYCMDLEEIIVPDDHPSYVLKDGVLFSRDCQTLIYHPAQLSGERYTIPEGVTRIGEYAFSRCMNLTHVTIPESVTEIGSEAFYRCENLISAPLPDSVTSIGGEAFFCCEKLQEVNIPDGVTAIWPRLFYNCSSLTRITLPDSITLIGQSAFFGCTNLSELSIPDGVRIDESPFAYCWNLQNIVITAPKDEPVLELIDGALIDRSAKRLICYCTGLPAAEFMIPQNVETIGIEAFREARNLERILIPEGVQKIELLAFFNSGLRYLEIPASVMQIAGNVMETQYLETIKVAEENPVYGVANGMLYDKATYKVVAFPCNAPDEHVVIPDGIKAIGLSAFNHCKNIKSIVLTDGVERIGDAAFRDCKSLTRIVIPRSVTTIDSQAFMGCDSLQVAIIPDSVTSIADSAFLPSNPTRLNLPHLHMIVAPDSAAEQYCIKHNIPYDSYSFSIDNGVPYRLNDDGVLYRINDDGTTSSDLSNP